MTHGMSIEDKLDNWAKYATSGQKAVLQEASARIRELRAAEEITRMRTTLERIAQYDIQAWALDALAPHERVRKAEDK